MKNNNIIKSFVTVLFVALSWGPLFAADDINPLYVVDGVKVDAKAESAVKAQEKAIEHGRIKAFNKLTEQLLPGQPAQFNITPAEAEKLTLDYEVIKQKQSAYTYKATLKFRFNEGAVNKFLASHKAEPAVAAKSTLVVIPVFKDKNGNVKLWGDGNPWYTVWAGAQKLSALQPMTVPIGDLADINELPINMLNNAEHLNGIARKYGAAGTLTATLEEVVDGSFTFNTSIHRLNNEDSKSTPSPLMAPDIKGEPYKAALTHYLKEFDQGDKITVSNPTPATQSQTIKLDIPIATIKDWMFMRKMLTGIPSVQEVKQNSLSTNNVNVTMKFTESVQNIDSVLGTKGFTLTQKGDNEWQIARTNPKH